MKKAYITKLLVVTLLTLSLLFSSILITNATDYSNYEFEPNDTLSSAQIQRSKNLFPSYPLGQTSLIYGNLAGYLTNGSDVDYYKLTNDYNDLFQVTQDKRISVELVVPSSSDYELEVYDSNNNLISGSYNGTSQNENVVFNALAYSTYYIKVFYYGGLIYDYYNLKINQVNPYENFNFSYMLNGYNNINSDYGGRNFESQEHFGMDINNCDGATIYNAHSGYVVENGYSGTYGNYVTIATGVIDPISNSQIYISYAHMKYQSSLTLYSFVGEGAIVGIVGNTGYTTGPHLHVAFTEACLLSNSTLTYLNTINPYLFYSNRSFTFNGISEKP